MSCRHVGYFLKKIEIMFKMKFTRFKWISSVQRNMTQRTCNNMPNQ